MLLWRLKKYQHAEKVPDSKSNQQEKMTWLGLRTVTVFSAFSLRINKLTTKAEAAVVLIIHCANIILFLFAPHFDVWWVHNIYQICFHFSWSILIYNVSGVYLVQAWGDNCYHEWLCWAWITCSNWIIHRWHKIYGDPRWAWSCHPREEGKPLLFIIDLCFNFDCINSYVV